MRPEDLVSALEASGVRCEPAEARRVLARVVAEGADDPAPRRPVRKALVEWLRAHARWERPTVVEEHRDPGDGATRFVLALEDGRRTEVVRIPLDGPGPGGGPPATRFSLCLSSQVGCAMACAFCATGTLGLDRDLDAAEIVGSFLAVRARTEGRVTGAVFMGQGEPFHNYDAVIRAAQVLSHPVGGRISADAISISTVGLVPALRRYTAEGHPYRLVVSLHSARAAQRRSLAPVAGRSPLPELAEAIAAHARATRDRVTVAYVLLGGVNTDPEEAEALRALLAGVPLRINLVDLNGEVGGFRRASDAERNHFFDALQVMRAPIVRRYSVGASRAAACGMLAAQAEVG